MRLYLIRHAQTAWNLEQRAQGHSDIPLDEIGEQQAIELGKAFQGVQLGRVFSSDLKRSVQTADRVVEATGAPMELTRDLRERSFGIHEGESFSKIRSLMDSIAERDGTDHFGARPEGGESARDVWDRLGRVQPMLQSADRDLAVVAHGGVCSLLLARLLRGNVETSRSFRFENTAVTELRRRSDGFWTLIRYADASHLPAPSAPMVDADSQPR
jgi:2,3-bisphosphoglycerate-dependent phosphoglycerate mutase